MLRITALTMETVMRRHSTVELAFHGSATRSVALTIAVIPQVVTILIYSARHFCTFGFKIVNDFFITVSASTYENNNCFTNFIHNITNYAMVKMTIINE